MMIKKEDQYGKKQAANLQLCRAVGVEGMGMAAESASSVGGACVGMS